eukprot:scaffold72208_cov63-Phaeocystis_antarctica.AAC.3
MDMLDLAFGLEDTSRLGCQVKVSKLLEGKKITLPTASSVGRAHKRKNTSLRDKSQEKGAQTSIVLRLYVQSLVSRISRPKYAHTRRSGPEEWAVALMPRVTETSE